MTTYANVEGELYYSANNNQFPIDVYSPSGYVVANGVYDTTTKTLTYKFTDWVNDKENISGSFDLSQFADSATAQKAGTYTLNYNLAGETYTNPITKNYNNNEYSLDTRSLQLFNK
ncbi:Ig-like domain-containing protein, partial [Staphylococcus hyicus]